jgi:hypothetical protein
MSERAISILVHGPAGSGKSTLALSGPLPCLMFDVERASRFVRLRKKFWNPLTEQMPVWDGTWDVCVVKVKTWDIAKKAYEYLKAGQHPFRSVSVDSISEAQVKSMEEINGRNQMQTHHWGRLLQNMGGFMRDLRDIVDDDDSAIESMVLICTSQEKEGRWRPYLQGSIKDVAPYLFDMTAYLYVDQEMDPTTNTPVEVRKLFTGSHPMYEAKSRVPGFPATISNPTISSILDHAFGPSAEVPSR